jgi:26S proteasome regulatory subunit N2
VILVTDTQPKEPKTLLELKVKKTAPAPAPGAPGASLTERVNDAYAARDAMQGSTQQSSGAAEAAGVLTAIDEDEDDEEAEVPREFEYHSEEEE